MRRTAIVNARLSHGTGAGSAAVLVSKVLTNSDATSGRIILPRVAVEANLPFVVGYRAYSFGVRDRAGREWEFVIKSWANGTEQRRVYVLEQAGDWLKAEGLGVGDAVGICVDSGALVVEANTPAVRSATVRPTYGAYSFACLPPPGPGKATPLAAAGTEAGRCGRNPTCTKPAGGWAFLSRHTVVAVKHGLLLYVIC